MGGFRLYLLARGLCSQVQPESLYRVLPQMVQKPRLTLYARERHKSIRTCKVGRYAVYKVRNHKGSCQKTAKQATSISRSAETYRFEMNRVASLIPKYPIVMDVYGVGEALGPQRIAEIGAVRRFECKQSLIQYYGVLASSGASG